MKKIYSLLLLGGLLLLGAQSAWGTAYLKGDFNSWGESNPFTGTPLQCSVTLSAHTKYEFKIYDDSNWYGNGGWVTTDITSWEFKTTDGNCTLITGKAGSYVFTLADGHKLSITYPDGNTEYTVSYDRSTYTWSGEFTYAYVWSGESPSETKILSPYPGAKFWSSITFKSETAPEKVIFNDGDWDGHHETSILDYHNGATYRWLTDAWTYYYHLTVGSQGWASMYLDFPAKVPANATAYYASAVTNTSVTLSAIEAGSVIPANTAVVVKAAEGTYDFYYDSGEAVSVGTNKFAGKITPTAVVASTVYVLSPASTTSSCVFGLYTGTTLGANKAYMLATDRPTLAPAVDRIEFIIENATNINAIDASEEVVKFFQNGQLFIKKNGVVYDMMGSIVK